MEKVNEHGKIRKSDGGAFRPERDQASSYIWLRFRGFDCSFVL
jgi:hypothetical protein